MFWKKQRQVEQQVRDYLQETQRCLDAFAQAFETYFKEGLSENFTRLVELTHNCESSSDQKRREIEETMYGRALIPESRGDILGMLEAVDLVPNKAESVLYQVLLQNMAIPPQYAEDFRRLVACNVETHRLLCEAGRQIFADAREVMPLAEAICAKEKASDAVERRLIKTIFDAPGETAEKMLLKELILEIGAISDRAENAADRLRITSIKRLT